MGQDIGEQDEGGAASAGGAREEEESEHEKLSSEPHFFHITPLTYSHIHFKRSPYPPSTMDALAVNVLYYPPQSPRGEL